MIHGNLHGGGRVGHKHQDVATNHGIVIARERELRDVALQKRNIVILSFTRPGARGLKDRGIRIDAHHRTLWPNEARGKQRDIPSAASKIEDFHSLPDASLSK
jgi:hypothetical protein